MHDNKKGYQLLQTKLFRPPPSPDIVTRERLFEKLDYGYKLPFTLVSAPSGFGKSSLVSDWLGNRDLKHVWFSLDKSDNNISQFLYYFIDAIRRKQDLFGSRSIPLIEGKEMPPWEHLNNAILNDISELGDQLIFVLDDYHFIRDNEIHQFILDLMRFPIPHFHLILITRRDPPFPLTDWRIKNQMTEIRRNDLSFTEDEIIKFFDHVNHINLNKKYTKFLFHYSEGWISGLRFLSFNIQSTRDVDDIISNPRILDNAGMEEHVSEILHQQSNEVRDYILKACIPDQFCGELLDHICIEDKKPGIISTGDSTIELLVSSNLFIVVLDDRKNWFRYHDMFLDLLRNILNNTYTQEEIRDAHISTADWLNKNGFVEGAIKHYIQGDEIGKASICLNRLRPSLINRSMWIRLSQIFDLFPEDIQYNDSILIVTRAWILMYQFKISEFFQILDKVKPWKFILSPGKNEKENLAGEYKTLLAYRSYNSLMEYKLCLEQSKEAIKKLDSTNFYARGLAWIFMGGSLQITRNAQLALEIICDGMGMEKSPSVHKLQYLVTNYIHWIDANLMPLLSVSKDLIKFGKKNGFADAIVYGKHYSGIVYYISNDLTNACKFLEEAYQVRYHILGIQQISVAMALAFTYMEMNDEEKAMSVVTDLKNHFSHAGGLSTYFTQSLEAEILWRSGNINKALEWVNSLENIPCYPISNFYSFDLVYIKLLIYDGGEKSLKKALDVISTLEEMLAKTKNNRFLPELYGLNAMLFADQGQDDIAMENLSKALELLNRGKFIRVFLDMGPKMHQLLKTYTLERGDFPYRDEIMSAFQHKMGNELMGVIDLTFREMEVLQLIRERLTNQKIGEKLYISEKTVKRHTSNILKKLDCKNRREAAIRATSLGILETNT